MYDNNATSGPSRGMLLAQKQHAYSVFIAASIMLAKCGCGRKTGLPETGSVIPFRNLVAVHYLRQQLYPLSIPATDPKRRRGGCLAYDPYPGPSLPEPCA